MDIFNIHLTDTDSLLEKILAGKKLKPDEAVWLAREGDLQSLALAARELDRQANPADQVGYAVSKSIVYSNVCQPNCPFCQGTVTRDDPRAFTKSADEVAAEAAVAVAAGATQIVLQGGHRIDLEWEYYLGLVRTIKERFPAVQVLGFSPTEIMVFNLVYRRRTAEIVEDLKAAGLGAMLGGGAETMVSRVPEYQRLLQGPWNEWFDVVHRCVDAGIPVVVPVPVGIGENVRERVGHLYRIRTVQERTSNYGRPAFRAAAVFSLPAPEGVTPISGHEYLRMVALTRLLAPNIPHVQAGFVGQGAKLAQVALGGGADDLGGTHLEFDQAELAAGRTGPMTPEEMERLIQDAGRVPLRRTGW